MPRKHFKRWMPNPAQLQENKATSFLGDLLHDPNLFHLNRHSVSVAFFFGLFIAFLPVPGQMIIGAACAWYFRCNLPITIALIWISNPFTIAPIFFFTYQFGTWILDKPVNHAESQFTWQWLADEIGNIWMPLFVGSIITGLFCGCVGYTAIKVFWRWQVIKSWQNRRAARATKKRDVDQS